MRVLNRHTHSIPDSAVDVSRSGKWGNPFPISSTRNRAQAIAAYRDWVVKQPELMSALHELAGRDLICTCSPRECHADVLLELANPGYNKDDHIPF